MQKFTDARNMIAYCAKTVFKFNEIDFKDAMKENFPCKNNKTLEL